ncbi:cleavage stimulation factor subunit 2 isoform X2 [Neocloeon triangulifer]|uniref:cleavage stimulation factor subunit 2 isoform X2 n=1 Tax=Neocloeon triangulifer TaxID=2078957 RepID=UPI00286ED47C|nr:cleavage stimulation factor subunit 2 isoform X2 [Neocloeon triangulifer]
MADPNLMDKSLRSVFVGNIPYEATEEKLKDIFSEVGPVLSFKLVYDRETGKPKGYGFCEYKDQETALSAMRNLNGYEIGGRTLRVDNACTEKSRMEMQLLLQGPVVENPYGDAVDPDKAPEAISKAVASLPPEQMFELMKQMKLCCQNNPSEARTMLMQNPQLAYALLQAQVVMRIVDPVTAAAMLHKANPAPKPILTADKMAMPIPPQIQFAASRPKPDFAPVQDSWPAAGPNIPLQRPPPAAGGDLDLRHLDPRARPAMLDQDLRMPPAMPPRDPRGERGFPTGPSEPFEPAFPRDPRRDRDMRDPRATFVADPRGDPRSVPPPVAVPRPPVQQRPPPNFPGAAGLNSASDQEKAQLIMQVLQLSDEQIAALPPEQRQSILVLKEQIAKSTQR